MSNLSKFKLNLKISLQIFGAITILLTLFPFIAIDHWTVRIFDFPHLQLTFLSVFALCVYFIKFDIRSIKDYIFVIALVACCFYQGTKIYPYTSLSSYEVLNTTAGSSEFLSFYTANVLQENKDTKTVLLDAKKFDADLVLFTETNKEWIENLRPSLEQSYRHIISAPRENTYGMILFSRYPFEEDVVKFMVEDTIPSIHTKIRLPSGKRVQLYAIHPAPPTPIHNPSSVDRDAELMKTAQLVRKSKIPVVVMGDFNDVAWSETTKLFQQASGLLDLRKGRGLFNTYNAKSWIFRWPLDHIFVSAHFRVEKVTLGSDIGSDHFPFFTKLSLEPALAAEQKLPEPSPEVLKEAFQNIKEEREEERD